MLCLAAVVVAGVGLFLRESLVDLAPASFDRITDQLPYGAHDKMLSGLK